MKTLSAALRGAGDSGTPLPTVIPQLAQLGADIRLAELSMFASASGVGKSVVALHIANKIKLPTLYMSADTSMHSQATRLASMVTGENMMQVAKYMEIEPEYYSPRLQAESSHISWCFNTSPTVGEIKDQMDSFAVMYGDYPHMTIVDNLRNLRSDEADFAAQSHACEDLAILARETGSAILVMHHVTGAYGDGRLTPGLSALENKVYHHPSLIVTFSYGDLGDLRVAVVKNRYAQADAAGKYKTFLPLNLSKMLIGAR